MKKFLIGKKKKRKQKNQWDRYIIRSKRSGSKSMMSFFSFSLFFFILFLSVSLPLTSQGKGTFCEICSCVLFNLLALRRVLSKLLVRPANCQTIELSGSFKRTQAHTERHTRTRTYTFYIITVNNA